MARNRICATVHRRRLPQPLGNVLDSGSQPGWICLARVGEATHNGDGQIGGTTTGVDALATWVVTAGFGSSLFLTWLVRGVSQHPRGMRLTLTVRLPPPYFPAPLVFSHLVMAAGGLVTWIGYLITDLAVLAWIALFVLLPVAVFGFSMFGRWLGSRRLRVATVSGDRVLAESRLPTIVVLCHGAFGATTIVLALLTTIGVGGSS